jgi:group II intron reverse transcriptase/maturase
MPHFTVDNPRACCELLDGTKATGGDGVTKAMYGQHLEVFLQVLHQKLHQMSYRPQPVRRVEIPKNDGSTRPLGICCLEDKILQDMARRIREARYEPVFIDTSYGFRPGRSGHDALRQLNHEVMSAPVSWIADLDLAQFFNTMPHVEILAVLAEQIADQQFLRLIARMLKAGVQTLGGVVYEELGSPQGAIVLLVIAHAFLDHVLDQWFVQTVRQHCRSCCALIRYADDALAVFEREKDAQRFMRVLPKRLGKFGLRLNREKTRVRACGKQQAWRAFRASTEGIDASSQSSFTAQMGRQAERPQNCPALTDQPPNSGRVRAAGTRRRVIVALARRARCGRSGAATVYDHPPPAPGGPSSPGLGDGAPRAPAAGRHRVSVVAGRQGGPLRASPV